MMNPYLDDNPYIIPTQQKQTKMQQYGMPVAGLGVQLYGIKNGRYTLRGTEGGKALKIPEPTVDNSNLSAFNLEGGQAAQMPATEGNLVSNTPETLPIKDLVPSSGASTEGLSAFNLEDVTAESLAGTDIAGSGAGTLVGDAGNLSGVTAGSLAGTDIAGSGAAEAGGATLGTVAGTVGGAVSTAVPYVALAKVGMPILGKTLKSIHGDSGVLGNMADLTEKDYMRPMENLTERAFGIDELPKWTGIFNPGGYLLKYAGCIIITACTSRDSYEVQIARRFRDNHMDEDQLTGYYSLCMFIVPFIQKYPLIKRITKKVLVDRLVDYGLWRMDGAKMRFKTSGIVSRLFLKLCRHVGRGVDAILASQEV